MDTKTNNLDESTTVAREVITNQQGYQEVSLAFRIYRSSKLRHQSLREGRIQCPMVDASRTITSYGDQSLRDTNKKELIRWAQAMGSDKKFAFLAIAYLSGPLSRVIRNMYTGRFSEDEINTGFIASIKGKINTGVIANGVFDQAQFDGFISSVHPQLKGQVLNEDTLYTDAFSECYLSNQDLEPILAHNLSNKSGGAIKTFIGKKISHFEMGGLLLGMLAQPIGQANATNTEEELPKAMLVRDLFDFYKYGWFPAHIEEGFFKAGLLDAD